MPLPYPFALLRPSSVPYFASLEWTLSIADAPEGEVVTVAALKEWAKIDNAAEDSTLLRLIRAATQYAEDYTWRAFLEREYLLTIDVWPASGVLLLPRPPALEVKRIYTVDDDGVETDFSPLNYRLDQGEGRGRVVLNGRDIPIGDRADRGIGIEYTAGYGGAEDVPDGIALGILAWATVGYESRILPSDPPPVAEGYLSPYRILSL